MKNQKKISVLLKKNWDCDACEDKKLMQSMLRYKMFLGNAMLYVDVYGVMLAVG